MSSTRRRKVYAANWKMNKEKEAAGKLAQELKTKLNNVDSEIVICPPFISLDIVSEILKGSNLLVGAQNMYFEDNGAFTGEISGPMLLSVGCKYVIIGHSERRQYFHEIDDFINKKIRAAFRNNLTPIVCIGETLSEKEGDETLKVLEKQIEEGLRSLDQELSHKNKEIIIAYEPIWAIGTGMVATPDEAQTAHNFIRQKLDSIFSIDKAQEIRILYGGSVKAENISEIICEPDIDGVLVGGASLDAESFSKIVNN